MRARLRASARDLLRLRSLRPTSSLRVLALRVPAALRRAAQARAARRAHMSSVVYICLIAVAALMVLLRAPLPTTPRRAQHADAVIGNASVLQRTLRVAAAEARQSARPTVLLVLADAAYAALAYNALCHLRRLRVSNYVMVALDVPAYEYLSARGARVYLSDEASQREAAAQDNGAPFGTRRFVQLSWRKCELVHTALVAGIDTILSDADVVWLREPALAWHPEIDVYASSDTRPAEQRRHGSNHVLNSGLYAVRSTAATRAAFAAIGRYARATRRSEQKAFNHVLCGAFRDTPGGPGRRVGRDSCEYSGRSGRVSVAVLDPALYPNGSSEWNSSAHTLHANYVTGAAEKGRRLKAANAWLVSDDATSCAR